MRANPAWEAWNRDLHAATSQDRQRVKEAFEVYRKAIPFRWYDRARYAAARDRYRDAQSALEKSWDAYIAAHPEPEPLIEESPSPEMQEIIAALRREDIRTGECDIDIDYNRCRP